MREQQIPPRKRSRPGSDGIKHGIPPPSRSSSGVRTCTQHGTLSWHRRTRSFRNKDSPCSRLREPVALHALCVCVCVCRRQHQAFWESVLVFYNGRTDGKREGRKRNFILHLASYGCACGVRVVDLCAVCCCMDFQKGSRESGWGRGGGGRGGEGT